MRRYQIITSDGTPVGRVEIYNSDVPNKGWELTTMSRRDGEVVAFVLVMVPASPATEVKKENN